MEWLKKFVRHVWVRRVLIAICAVMLLGCASCVVFHQGPYQEPQPLPPAKILDVHVHTAGVGSGDSGCFVSDAMRRSFKFGVYLKSFWTNRRQLEEQGDASIIRKISERLAESEKVGAAIILALDGAVDEAGELDRELTEVYVPNKFVAAETAKYTNLFWGASINPRRKDALERLQWAHTNGARLVKWIPSIMLFDPADESLKPFYEKLIEYDLPLLTHAGQERSFTNAKDELCDPQRLHLPLKLGVTVVVAHIASTGANEGERDTDRLARMMNQYTNLYSEISSLTQINKPSYLRESIQRPEWQGRLVYGSDFPLINTALVSPHYYPLRLTLKERLSIAAIDNPWDQDVALKQALGVSADVFARSEEIFGERRK